jgi:hypothetical protein
MRIDRNRRPLWFRESEAGTPRSELPAEAVRQSASHCSSMGRATAADKRGVLIGHLVISPSVGYREGSRSRRSMRMATVRAGSGQQAMDEKDIPTP